MPLCSRQTSRGPIDRSPRPQSCRVGFELRFAFSTAAHDAVTRAVFGKVPTTPPPKRGVAYPGVNLPPPPPRRTFHEAGGFRLFGMWENGFGRPLRYGLRGDCINSFWVLYWIPCDPPPGGWGGPLDPRRVVVDTAPPPPLLRALKKS